MKRILKYRLEPTIEPQIISGNVIKFDWQHNELTVWSEVEQDPTVTAKVMGRYAIVPTGRDVPERGRYVASAVSDDLVFHLYEVPI